MHGCHVWYTSYCILPLQSYGIAKCLPSFFSAFECLIIPVVQWLLTYSTFPLINLMSAGLAENWTQHSVSHVATMSLLLSQNCLRSNLRALIPGETCPQTPLVLHAYLHASVLNRHSCNSSSENPGYRPCIVMLFKRGSLSIHVD